MTFLDVQRRILTQMHPRRRLTLLLGLFCVLGLSQPASAAHVNVVELDNQIINPVTQQYLLAAIERSTQEGAECLIILLDTPGGLLESTPLLRTHPRAPAAVDADARAGRGRGAGHRRRERHR